MRSHLAYIQSITIARSRVILPPPNVIPRQCYAQTGHEDGRTVVHAAGGDGEVARHGKERNGKAGPCWRREQELVKEY